MPIIDITRSLLDRFRGHSRELTAAQVSVSFQVSYYFSYGYQRSTNCLARLLFLYDCQPSPRVSGQHKIRENLRNSSRIRVPSVPSCCLMNRRTFPPCKEFASSLCVYFHTKPFFLPVDIQHILAPSAHPTLNGVPPLVNLGR